jgi:hypothetical protein
MARKGTGWPETGSFVRSDGRTMDMERLGSLILPGSWSVRPLQDKDPRCPDNRRGVQFINKLIGLNCFITHSGDQLAKLRAEIQRAFDDIRKDIQEAFQGKKPPERQAY